MAKYTVYYDDFQNLSIVSDFLLFYAFFTVIPMSFIT